MRAIGAPAEVLATLQAGRERDEFEVWPENWDTVVAFEVVSTQWRGPAFMADGRAYWQGLDYTGVEAGLRLAGIAATPDLFVGLRLMEAAARNQLNGIVEAEA
ncbi:MAG: DUF1799 domain-containing protein [Pseudomonadota bacterium]|nr:DUF1799 domain-containing protein [Pseudomonadota bacterium]